MPSRLEANLERLGKKLSERKDGVFCSYESASFSTNVRMNHDKKAEPGKKILREKILGRV